MFKRAFALALLVAAVAPAAAPAATGYGAREPITADPSFDPADLAVAHGDGVFSVEVWRDSVRKFTLDGEPVWSAAVFRPASVAEHGGVLYVLSGWDEVQKLDASTGARVGSFPLQGVATGMRVDVAGDGTVYVLDRDDPSRSVKRFAPDGTPLGGFGSHGTGPGQFTHLSGLAIDDARELAYVVDYHQRTVSKFGLDGTFELRWTTPSGTQPHDPGVDPDGTIYVPDTDTHSRSTRSTTPRRRSTAASSSPTAATSASARSGGTTPTRRPSRSAARRTARRGPPARSCGRRGGAPTTSSRSPAPRPSTARRSSRGGRSIRSRGPTRSRSRRRTRSATPARRPTRSRSRSPRPISGRGRASSRRSTTAPSSTPRRRAARSR
jgi:hypothetical protein